VLASVTIHKSMCYACDVQPVTKSGGLPRKRLVVSTSFYDKLLCVWDYDSEVAVE
jgi:diphthamide biosynthesis protein 7